MVHVRYVVLLFENVNSLLILLSGDEVVRCYPILLKMRGQIVVNFVTSVGTVCQVVLSTLLTVEMDEYPNHTLSARQNLRTRNGQGGEIPILLKVQ